MHDVLFDAGIVEKQDLSIGASLSGAYLRREIDESRRDLGLQSLDAFIIEGLAWQIGQQENGALARSRARDDKCGRGWCRPGPGGSPCPLAAS